jgi:hypothetical protein
MLQPPDFTWRCPKCGYEVEGSYSETGFESPALKCPKKNCNSYMQKHEIKKRSPYPENLFKKY